MTTDRDYYAILQVSRNASPEQIQRSYERLSKRYDPATSQKPRAAARYQDVQEAYETLGDSTRRAQYDRLLRRGGVPGAAAASGSSADVLSNRVVWAGAGGMVAVVLLVLALIIVVGGSGDNELVVTPPTPTLDPNATPIATAPPEPPEVEGDTVTTASGLQYIVLEEGDGDTPTAEDTVRVHYTGWLAEDRTKFDSSVDRGEPTEFPLTAVIAGWTEGLQLMQEGARHRLIIPAPLAYGEAGAGTIPPNSDLIFDVELIEIVRPEGDESDEGDEGDQAEDEQAGDE